MHCSSCGKPVKPEEATREVLIKNGKSVDVYLCEECAQKAAAAAQAHSPAAQVLVAAIHQATGSAGDQVARALTCPQCRTTFAQFRHDGVLGCPACYQAFEQPLSPMLERAHEGGTHHIGKVPRRASSMRSGGAAGSLAGASAGGSEPSGMTGEAVVAGSLRPEPMLSAQERVQRASALRKQLAEAVAAEQYERAARLRDELRKLDPPGQTGSAS
jgi:protein arginine kinase activator